MPVEQMFDKLYSLCSLLSHRYLFEVGCREVEAGFACAAILFESNRDLRMSVCACIE